VGVDSNVTGRTVALLEGERRSLVSLGWDYQFLPVPETVSPEPLPVPACTDRASFVSDVTIPDNTYVSPGQSFVKTWRLRNTGTCTWNAGYALVFADGHRMGGLSSVPLRGSVGPGETVDLSVTLTAPASDGAYEGRWQLRNADGAFFGSGSDAKDVFWVRVIVGQMMPGGWRGEYYGNRSLTGAPKLTRNDPAIDFSWGRNAPTAELPQDAFSVRWTRVLMFEEGTYRFRAWADDGMRLWVDGALVIDAWKEGAAREITSDRHLSAGNHTVRVEYFEAAGEAQIQVAWEKLAQYPDWKGEYWSNRKLSGNPALARNDSAIDFQWGLSAPAAGLPADDFSARWTRTAGFDGGQYRFYAVVDDGVRVYVDDILVLDDWRDGERRGVESRDVGLSAGNHSVRVEYYERGGQALIQVWWTKVASPSYPDWKGEYWSNRKLKGNPTLTRNDPSIDFQWGSAGPAAGLPPDDFSARWSRKVTFEAGVYRFHAWTDDGIRVYVDDDLVLDEWHTSNGDQVYMVDLTLRDRQRVVVEYYERGGQALVKFWWKRIGDWPTPIPNQPPLAVNDVAITDEDTPVYINVLANDSDPDGDDLVVSDYQASGAKGATVSCTSAGACSYTPPADFSGSDTFTYTVSDGEGGTATAIVTVTINPVNDPPVAVDDVAVTDEGVAVEINVLANDSDSDSDPLVVSDYQVTSAYSGTVNCTTAGVCIYTPPTAFTGTDTFTYTASDGKGGTSSATVAVTLSPAPTPEPGQTLEQPQVPSARRGKMI
jgi:hypothetical protein